jgi:hypothetical protein
MSIFVARLAGTNNKNCLPPSFGAPPSGARGQLPPDPPRTATVKCRGEVEDHKWAELTLADGAHIVILCTKQCRLG